MQLITKHSIRVVEYNGNFDSDNDDRDIEFVNVNLLCNQLSLQLPANKSINQIQKMQIIETDNKDDEPHKPTTM